MFSADAARRVGQPLIAAACLLVAAAYNGFPLLFSDSGEYFGRSIRLLVPEYRTFGYPLFLAAVWPEPSLWAGIVAQSALLGALVHQLVRVLSPAISWRRYVAGALVVALFTAAPWISGQLMPDVFAPITVLGVYLAATQWERLSRFGRALSLVAIAVGITTHATHLWLAIGLLVGYAIVAWRTRRTAIWRGIGRSSVAVAAGSLVLMTINFAQTGELFFSRGGNVYLLAHLVDAGFAQRILHDECPQAGYALCPYQRELQSNAAAFIWAPDSPLRRIGGFDVATSESRRLLGATLRRFPLEFLASTVRYTARQMTALWTFDGLRSYARLGYVADFISYYRPDEFRSFVLARQQQGVFERNQLVPIVHEIVIALAAVASAWLMVGAWRRRAMHAWDVAGFHAAVWLVLLGNAALCANLSGVFDRYQTRVAWLLPLAVLLSFAAPAPPRDVHSQ